MTLLLFAIWIIFSVFEGWREALSDSGNYSWKYKHYLYTGVRFLMGVTLNLVLFFIYNWWLPCVFFSIAIVLGFSFLHNGFYFVFRNYFAKQKLYPKGFMDKGSTAIFELGFKTRTTLFVVSIDLILFLFFCLP